MNGRYEVILSIVTVCYNAQDTIQRTLDSVEKSIVNSSLFSNIEYLIIDGNSSDNTLSIIREFCNRNRYAKYISETDAGIYDAYNKGLYSSIGKFIWFVNADDVIKIDAVELILNNVINNELISLHCFSLNRINPKTGFNKVSIRSVNKPIKLLSPVCHTPAIVWNAKDLMSIQGFDETYKICADFKSIQVLASRGYGFKGYKYVVIDMYLGGVSSNYRFEILKSAEQLRVIITSGFSILDKIKAVFYILIKFFRNMFINPVVKWFKYLAC